MPLPSPSPVGSLLWRSLRVYQVYGANTDVGKTIFSTLLCKAATRFWDNEQTAFLKPVSTGSLDEADDRHVQRFAPEVTNKTLFQYDLAVSPHTAALASKGLIPPDETLLAEISKFASRRASLGHGWLFVETAGGVHSPGPSGSTQAELYMPLRLPVILIGDAKLGGISQTISAFESLKIRGYDVETVLLFREDMYQNHLYLTDYFRDQHGIPVKTAPEPPTRDGIISQDVQNMLWYYETTSSSTTTQSILSHLAAKHSKRIERLESMRTTAHRTIWYPFTQQKNLSATNITVIDSARGDHFQTFTTDLPPSAPLLQPTFDASASWWTQGLGHGSPSLALAAAYAAGRYGHVMFAEAIHEPALALAENLLAGMANPRLTRVFYSDNGSTGAEVAVKMALRAARVRYGWGAEEEVGVLGLRGSYHGDTIGAMDCSEPCVFNEKVEWYEGRGFWFEYPTVMCREGRWVVEIPGEIGLRGGSGGHKVTFASLGHIFSMKERESSGEGAVYERYILDTLERLHREGRKFGALILEPVVLGAGGMLLVDPLFQRALVNAVRRSSHLFGQEGHRGPKEVGDSTATWAGLPVVFDEVFTGIYRLGRFSAASFLDVDADISVHAKLLTGGLVPLCATLASESVFEAFASDDKSDALLHGHSYTAHAVGCQVALESLRQMKEMDAHGEWAWAKTSSQMNEVAPKPSSAMTSKSCIWSVWGPDFVNWVSQRTAGAVGGVWALGTVLAIHMETKDGFAGYKSNAAKDIQALLTRGAVADVEGDGAGWNVHSRVLGNVLYVMAGHKTKEKSIRQLESVLRQALSEREHQ
ncbi:pyridoxal phosphate-dependent transferase [Lasiosphaeria hispida]|uniref:Pyridoxal phosphate-dependent transferase n=1 Tax=Lasiosphaeria hispida TaxID=260671 RepID=A0AAJ0MB30_9PEZI|nr:pyridoxal phosphate-dependent transferase [Lasiosphaeria hispida]